MDADSHISNLLHTFAGWPVVFGLQDMLRFSVADMHSGTLIKRILSDNRFVSLQDGDSEQQEFLAKVTVFRFFLQFNCRLARARIFSMGERQLVGSMSTLCSRGRWNRTPTAAIAYACEIGFISPAVTTGQYVFPIAFALQNVCVSQPGTIERSVDELWSIVFSRDIALKQARNRLLRIGFSQFDKKIVRIVKAREGLIGARKRTLEQLGKRYGLTRERIRQIEASFWREVKGVSRISKPFHLAFLCDLMARSGSPIVSERRADVRHITFLAKCAQTTYDSIPFSYLMIMGNLPERLQPLSSSSDAPTLDGDEIAKELEASGRICLGKHDSLKLGKLLARLKANRITLGRMVYFALRSIGHPAHFSEVTQAFQQMFPHREVTARNVHSTLGREQHGIVWVGLKGTFALREWGFSRPSKGLFEVATQIVKERFAQTRQPVPFAVIVAEFPKYRRVFRRSSVTMAMQLNPTLRRVSGNRFLPRAKSEEPIPAVQTTVWEQALSQFEESRRAEARR